jgi:predicted DNA-binding transcriptional regulator YafY
MAKDTEKLIRQLSLISFLMAERRPVTASEIRQNVEGYSNMNEDAFARRFYADRAELEALGIELHVDKPIEGAAEQENYSLPPENFFLDPVEFSDDELAALGTALQLLDGEFAYAEPLRLALQQISWGRPSPLAAPEQRGVALGITGAAGGHDVSQRLAKIETAIFRRKTVTFAYYTMERDALEERKVDPYQLVFQGGQFYLVGRSHERDAIRVFRLSRVRGKVAYATKAEHDFQRPDAFDPREYANRIHWQFGDPVGTAEVWVADRIAWQVERHFAPFGQFRPGAGHPDLNGDSHRHDRAPGQGRGGVVFSTPYANARGLVSWALGLGEHVRVLGPPELAAEYDERVALLVERHTGDFDAAPVADRVVDAGAGAPGRSRGSADRGDGAIRPERFARLVTLASILIEAGRERRLVPMDELSERLQASREELREDVSVLNVVNFGAGTYVLFADVRDDGMVEVDLDAYSDSFARPARLLPVEAKALISAIDLIGDHIPSGSLASVREKVVAALGRDPVEEGLQIVQPSGEDSGVASVVSRAIVARRMLRFEYYKENEDEFSERRVEPYALMNGREGWYVVTWDPEREDVRHFRLDRIRRAEVTDVSFEPRPEVDPAADLDGWPRTGEVPASRRARVWVSPERARWAREERTVLADLADGATVVEIGFAGTDWLVREVLKEAGDAAVLEPEDAREAVRAAVARLPQPVGRS